MSRVLFPGFPYFIHPTTPPHEYKKIKAILLKHGAKISPIESEETVIILHSLQGATFENLCRENRTIISTILYSILFNIKGTFYLYECVRTSQQLVIEKGAVIASKVMEGKIICCTGIEQDQRARLVEMVKQMGGDFSFVLTLTVTHLIALNTSSEKYQKAVSLNIEVVTPRWIEDCFKDNILHPVLEYRLPLFMDCIISVSRLEGDKRSKIERLTVENGGRFVADLSKKVNYLITDTPSGKKFIGAINWKIPVVKTDWFFACIEQRVRLGVEPFQLTLEEAQNAGTNFVDSEFSKITGSEEPQAIQSGTQQKPSSIPKPVQPPVQEEELVLDGCGVYLSGFPIPEEQKLIKLLREAGATRYTSLEQNVTHFVVDRANDLSLKPLLNNPSRVQSVKIVNSKWIENCVSQKQKLNEEDFSVNIPFHFGLDSEVPATQFPAQKPSKPPIPAPKAPSKITEFPSTTCESSEGTITYSPFNMDASNVFSNCNILIRNGFIEPDMVSLRKLISDGGGLIFDEEETLESCPQLIHFIVCPHGASLSDNNNAFGKGRAQPAPPVVSFEWIVRCRQAKKVLDPTSHVLFQPLTRAVPFPEMIRFRISISGFDAGEERDNLKALIRLLGAEYTDNLNKQNSHLICRYGQGGKYESAMRWKTVRVVSVKWLCDCALKGQHLSEFDYPVSDLNNNEERKFQKIKSNHNSLEEFENNNDYEDAISQQPVVNREPIFAGVTVYIKKIASPNQAKIKELIKAMGGAYSYSFDKNTTHIVHEGKAENIKEFKSNRIHTVSPVWIEKCYESWQLLPEVDFPPTLNTKMNLGIISASQTSKPVTNISPVNSQVVQKPKQLVELTATSKKRKTKETESWEDAIKNQEKRLKMKQEEKIKAMKLRDPEELPLSERLEQKTKDLKLESEPKTEPDPSTPLNMTDKSEFQPFQSNNSVSKSLQKNLFGSPPNEYEYSTEPVQSEVPPISEPVQIEPKPQPFLQPISFSSNIVQPIPSSMSLDPNLNKLEEESEAKEEENPPQDDLVLASVQSFIDLLEKKVPLGNTANQVNSVAPVARKPKLVKRKTKTENESPIKRTKTTSLVHIADEVPLEGNASSTSQDSMDDDEDSSFGNSQVAVLVNHHEQNGRKKIKEKLQKSISITSELELEEHQAEMNKIKKILSTNNVHSQQTPKAAKTAPNKASITPIQELKLNTEPKVYAPLPPLPPKQQQAPPKNSTSCKILISNASTEVKKEMEKIASSLKMTICRDFSPQCTHVVTPNLAGSPKCLAAIVSGKWLVKETWLRECEKQGQLVDEKPFEWREQDVEKSEVKSFVKGIPLCKEKLQKTKSGLFSQVNAICLMDEQSQGWKQILEAGGATVRIQASLNEADLKGVTHVFCESKKLKQKEQYMQLLKRTKVNFYEILWVRNFICTAGDFEYSEYDLLQPKKK